MQKFLRIFLDALLKSEVYGDEVSEWDAELFLMSAKLHDIGEIAVSCAVLSKADALTQEEFENIKEHADFGLRIIRQIKKSVDYGHLLHHAEAMAGSHHERWDGSGYPRGLKGPDIPLQGRIMAIVDTYYALISDRPYRAGKTHAEAVEIIRSGGGTHFDPDLVKVFLKVEELFEKVWFE